MRKMFHILLWEQAASMYDVSKHNSEQTQSKEWLIYSAKVRY